LLLADAGTFVVSAGLLLTLPRLASRQPAGTAERTAAAQPAVRAAGWRRLTADAAGGVRYVWQDQVIRIVTLAFCAVVLFSAVDDVALVFLARRTLHGSNSVVSLIYAGAGAGLLVGFLLIARAGARLGAPALILIGYVAASLGNLLTGFSVTIVAALGFQVVRGLGLAAMDVGHGTLIQRRVPDGLLGRVFGNVYGAVGAAAGLSYVFGGLLLDATSARVTLIVAGAGGLAAAALAAIALPRALRLAPVLHEHEDSSVS
jgi:MFS family permease